MIFEHVVDYLLERELLELSNAVAGDMHRRIKSGKLSFGHLFPGNDLRIVIPLESNEIASSILRKIKEAGLKVDFDEGMVSDGKRKVRIGKFILGKKSPFTDEEKEWFKGQGEAIEALREAERAADEYSVVISRSPLDIVRMSDHEASWTSCHSQGKSYFQCAVDEAKYGGIIAYLVRTSDLAGVDVQQPEIFVDSDRDISGIVPVARIRLRRFTNIKKGYDLAVPEVRVYGRNVPGFIDTVRRWALRAQGGVTGGERPNMREFVRRGGFYKDSGVTDSVWFNHLYGDSSSSGDVAYHTVGEDEDLAGIYERECARIEREYWNHPEGLSLHWEVNVNDDGEASVSYNVVMTVELDARLKKNAPGPGSPEYESVKKDIQDFIENDLELGYVNDITFFGSSVSGGIKVDIDYSANSTPDVDGLIDFILHVREHYEERDEVMVECLRIFAEHGYIEVTHSVLRALGYGKASDVWNESRFKHFNWKKEEPGDFYDPTHGEMLGIRVWLFDRDSSRKGYKIFMFPQLGVRDMGVSLYKIRDTFPGFDVFQSSLMFEFNDIASKQIGNLSLSASKQKLLFKDLDNDRVGYEWSLVIDPKIDLSVDAGGNVYLGVTFRISLLDEVAVAESSVAFIDYLDNHLNDFLNVAGDLFRRTIFSRYMSDR